MWRVPDTLFQGQAVAVVGTGFSLKKEDIQAVITSGLAVIAVNNAYEWAESADMLYACDTKWWKAYRTQGALGGNGNTGFKGLKVSLEETPYSDVLRIGNGGSWGFDPRNDHVRTGKNSATQAAHIAVHGGAQDIILLGCDARVYEGRPSHFFGEHAWRQGRPSAPFDEFLRGWQEFANALPAGVRIVNCSPDSAIECFRKQSLFNVLDELSYH